MVNTFELKEKMRHCDNEFAAPLYAIIYNGIERYESGQITAKELLIVLRCLRDGVYMRWSELLQDIPDVGYFWDDLRNIPN